MLKKFLAALGTVALAAGMSVIAVAAPAAAHHATVSGTAVCAPAGGWDVTWTIANSETRPGTIIDSNRDVVPEDTTVLPAKPAESATFTEHVSTNSPITLTVTTKWFKTSPSNSDVTDWPRSFTVSTFPTCADPKDATGTFTFTPPTCDADGSYSLSGAVNATFTVFDGTTTTTGLGNSANNAAISGKTYTITIVPNAGHSLTDATLASDSYTYKAATECGMEVALYVYKKLDPTKPASWENSGVQTLIISKVGNTWFDESTFPTLPTWVCGPAWGVQQDMTKDWDAATWDTNSDDRFDWPANITYPIDNIGWPPLYDAKHADLSTYLDVPDCVETSGVPTSTSKSCQVDSKNWLTLPAVNGGEWIVTKGSTVLTYASYDGAPAAGFGTYTIELKDANANDQYTVKPAQTSWSWNAVDPDDLNCATAEDPNWADQKCNPKGPGTTIASYTIIPVTGVLYEVSLDNGVTWTDATPPGTDPIVTQVSTFPTKVMVRAYPAPGYELVGTSEASHQFVEATDCIDKDARAFVETVPPTCEADGAINTTTISTTNASWTTTPLPSSPGKYDMVAQADAGHAFADGTVTMTIPLEIEQKLPAGTLPCDLPILASVYPTVSSTPLTCTAAGTYTIGAVTPGTVKWSINNGPLIDGGTFSVKGTEVISLVASPTDPADTLATDDLADPTWTNPVVLTFTAPDPDDCTTELTTLALTGIGSGMGLSLAGGLVLLGFGGLLVFGRTKQTGRHVA